MIARTGSWSIALLTLLLAWPEAALAQACSGVRCSGHGTCMEERSQPYCFCEEGFSAEGLECQPSGAAHDPERPPGGMHIVGVALAEEGRDLPHIGATRHSAPGPLAGFLRPDDLWCSDFVSWVYRAAGIPFSGGYAGGWHLTNNQMIRAWYARRGMFVAKDTPEWRDVRPMPGDYVRIHTPTWGHSAIVRYASSDTLYTIEGNAGGRVITTRYTNWRTHERIDGFGLTTDGAARMNSLGVDTRGP
jgi:hypothetical protein